MLVRSGRGTLFYSNFKKPSSGQAQFLECRRDCQFPDRIVTMEMISI
jgi:hypothetical protein